MPVAHLAGVIAVAAGLSDRPVDVVAGKRPANQPSVGNAIDSEGTRPGRLGLLGIRSDDFQVRPGAEPEQRVVRPETNVLATSLGPDAEAFLQVGDCRGQIRGGVDEMVNQHLNLASIM